MNVLTMFMDAGITIKSIVLLLIFFSLYSWYIVFQKQALYRRIRLESAGFVKKFWQCKDLAEAYKAAKENNTPPEAMIFQAAYRELQKLNKTKGPESHLGNRLAGMEPLKRAVSKSLSIEISRLGHSLPFLASVGSASPFIGLLGTVWGIMHAFHEIGVRGSASLAAIAPGISEALVVTVVGLAVAIPAVLFYNHYTSQLAVIEENSQAFAADFLNLIEREFLARQATAAERN